MPNTIRKVNYAYLTTPNKAGAAACIFAALRAANVNLLVFCGFPHGRNKAQIDLVTDNFDALKALARCEATESGLSHGVAPWSHP